MKVVEPETQDVVRNIGHRGHVTRAPDVTNMPAIPDGVELHYVGYTAVGEVQMASISILQKPLLHLYSEFLKTGGCTARKTRDVMFTENGLRICQNMEHEVSEQFFHYALITYTNTVVLRTFKSHGKKLYGMFEPTSPLSFTTGDRPETLFPLEKRFNKIDNIPTFPLVTMLYRPDPPNNHLHCHAFACISIDQSNQVFATIQSRVKTFFEDYETLSVDDNMFSSPVPDFWKLTEDGWRMTMTKKKRRPAQEESEEHEDDDDDDEEDENSQDKVTQLRRQSKDLAVFAQAKVLSRRTSSNNELFADYRPNSDQPRVRRTSSNNELFVDYRVNSEQAKIISRRPSSNTEFADYRVPNSDSGVESPTTDNAVMEPKPEPLRPQIVRPGSPRSSRDRPKYIRGGVRVLPAPPERHHSSMSSPEYVRRAPVVPPKPQNRKYAKELDAVQPGPPSHMVNGHVPDIVPRQRGQDRNQAETWKPEGGRVEEKRRQFEPPNNHGNQSPRRPEIRKPAPKPSADIWRPVQVIEEPRKPLKPLKTTEDDDVMKSADRVPKSRNVTPKSPDSAPKPPDSTPKSPDVVQGDLPEMKHYHREPQVETRPIEEWDWEEVGDEDKEVGKFSRGKAIRRPSTEPRPKSPETVPFQRTKAIRRISDAKKEQKRGTKQLHFEGPVLMTKSDTFMSEESKKASNKTGQFSPKENEIEMLLSNMEYSRGIDGMERTASMMNFERSLGYLP